MNPSRRSRLSTGWTAADEICRGAAARKARRAGGRPGQTDKQFCDAERCARHRTARCAFMAKTAQNDDFMKEGGHPGIGFGHRSGWAPPPVLNWQRARHGAATATRWARFPALCEKPHMD
jgi:hypothetical protein